MQKNNSHTDEGLNPETKNNFLSMISKQKIRMKIYDADNTKIEKVASLIFENLGGPESKMLCQYEIRTKDNESMAFIAVPVWDWSENDDIITHKIITAWKNYIGFLEKSALS